jgi:hypothetical protein
MNVRSQNKPLGSRSWVLNIGILIGLVVVLAAIRYFLLEPTLRGLGIGQADHMFVSIVWWVVTAVPLGWAYLRFFKS